MMRVGERKWYWAVTVLVSFAWYFFLPVAETLAVMPPAHYQRMARSSLIKAIAMVKQVEVLSETKQSTAKKVRFRLEQALEDSQVPQEFSGTCQSVDHPWQDPGVGGTIYYYPAEGARVLVTVSADGGAITMYRGMTPDLEEDIRQNGLRNILRLAYDGNEFTKTKQDGRDQWFTFHGPGQVQGFLHITSKPDPEEKMSVEFTHEFLVGEPDGKRNLYSITTQSRTDETLTPEWITITTTLITPEKKSTFPVREFGFRSKAADKVADGILAQIDKDRMNIGIPPMTTTDFLLFSLVETLPYQPGNTLRMNLLETLEMHLKKGGEIRYLGRDPAKQDLHEFAETGPVNATYWLNDRHELMEVRWDSDKVFRRSSDAEAMTILQ